MDNFEVALNKAKEVATAAYKRTEEAIIVQKLKLELARLKNNLNKAYAALGKAVYKTKDFDISNYKELTEQIEYIKAEIGEIQAEIRKAKCKDVCSSCGKEIENNVTFCSHCGAKQER